MALHGPLDPAHLSELDHRLRQKLYHKLPMGKLSKPMGGYPMLPHGVISATQGDTWRQNTPNLMGPRLLGRMLGQP